MSKSKRYYWIKLPIDFFQNIVQKKMRKQPQGLLYQIIYLKLMLLSCNNDGYIEFKGVYDTLSEEISENISEDEEIVNKALQYFENNSLLEYVERDIYIPQTVSLTGSETDNAERQRKHRAKTTKQEVLQSNREALQSNINVTKCNTEIDKEIDIEKDKDKDINALHCDTEVTKSNNKETSCSCGVYGTHQNIKLSDAEYNELCDLYSKQITDTIIYKMSVWVKQHNKPNYPSCETIKEWINKDYSSEEIKKAKNKAIMQNDNYDLEQSERQALKK